jgi:hypothetical protein
MALRAPKWISQMIQSYKITKESDRFIGLILLGTFLFAGAVAFALTYLLITPLIVVNVISALLFGTLVALFVFGRRAQTSAYARIEGQPGAAAAVLGMLRRGWKTDPAIAFNKNQDVVHRLVGPPGIVLIGEGNPSRVKALLATERKKHERLAADVPVHEVVIGYDEGEVRLTKLVKHVRKIGRKVKPAEITEVLGRLRALDATRGAMPIPKGPVPTSMKGQRGNRR